MFGLKSLPSATPSAQRLADLVRKSKAFCFAVHPYRRWGTGLGGHMEKLKGLMGVEALNGGCDSEENLKAREASLRLNLLPLAGRGAHFPEDMGIRAAWLPRPVRAEPELISALRAGLGRPVFLLGEDNECHFWHPAGQP